MANTADDSILPHLHEVGNISRRGIIFFICGILPVAGWMAFAPLSSAVIAPGFVKVDLNRHPVQHVEGGVVRQVLVRDGQRVQQGEPLLLLGDVSVDADLKRLSSRVWAERASATRLEAEQKMVATLVFSKELSAAAKENSQLSEQLQKEQSLFRAKRAALTDQITLLRRQHEGIEQEMIALRAQIINATDSLKHQKNEVEKNRDLLIAGFISPTRIGQLEANVADYGVKLEEKRSDLARASQRSADIDLRIRSLEGEYRQQASEQLSLTAARLSELEQELRKFTDASARQVITAPVTGDVIDLRYTSPGSVVSPRDTIVDIVPVNPRLVTEAKIRPEDVNRVHQGQTAEIRFPGFKYRTTKLVKGKVIYVSADRLVDRATNLPYYNALVEADSDSLAEAGDVKLQAGMPAEVYITGEKRTPLQYLMSPITDAMQRAGREQ